MIKILNKKKIILIRKKNYFKALEKNNYKIKMIIRNNYLLLTKRKLKIELMKIIKIKATFQINLLWAILIRMNKQVKSLLFFREIKNKMIYKKIIIL